MACAARLRAFCRSACQEGYACPSCSKLTNPLLSMSEKKGEWIRDITPSDTRGVRMISRALTHGYPVTPEVRELIVEKLLEIVETSKCPRIKMNAIKGLLAADKANIQLLAVANTLARDYFGGGSLQEQ